MSLTIFLHVMMLNPMVAPLVEHILLLLVSLIRSSPRKCLRRPFNRKSRNKQQTCILQISPLAFRSTSRNSISLRAKKKLHSMKTHLTLSSAMNVQAAVSRFLFQICPAAEESFTHACFENTANCLKDNLRISVKKTQND